MAQAATRTLRISAGIQSTLKPTAVDSGAKAVARELSLIRGRARAWADALPQQDRSLAAGNFVRLALSELACLIAPGLDLSEPDIADTTALDAQGRSLAAELGVMAARTTREDALHQLTSLYPALLSSEQRGALGAFYTPPPLVERLLDMSQAAGVDWSTARVLDPAAGGGAFLLGALNRLLPALTAGDARFILAQLGHRLCGLELDPQAAQIAQTALEIALAEIIIAAKRPLPRLVQVANSLEYPTTSDFDLVIGNPPYGRVTLPPSQRERFGRSLYGHANLYGVFTDLALQFARPKAVVAFLTPTSVLSGQYYTGLRRLLQTKAPPLAIDVVHARKGVFEDVLQETLLATYRHGGRNRKVAISQLEFDQHGAVISSAVDQIVLPEVAGAPWLAPRESGHAHLLRCATQMVSRLADWGYEVSTGPLVWNRHKTQLKSKSGPDCLPLIWAEAVTADGRFEFRAVKRNHEPFFEITMKDDWLTVRQGCVLVQRTTAKEQARRLIAAEMTEAFVRRHGGVVVENHLNMVRATARPKVTPATVAAVLNSKVVDEVFRCISGSVAVSAYELRSLPLPSAEAMREIESMVSGKAPSDAVESALRRLYESVG